ncbi:MAG: phytanoyl-CoA dioxygenase family protein [Pseudomonadota bacterium]
MALNADQIAVYRATGYLTVPGAVPQRVVAGLCAEWQRLWDAIDINADHRFVHWRKTDDGGRVADRLDPVSQLSETYARTALSPALLGLAESLLGGPAFVLKDKLISKAPQTGGYSLHQDWPYWASTGVKPGHVLTIAVALDPTTQANGATAFYRGQHKTVLPSDAGGLDVDPKALAGLGADTITMAPGDAVCFHSLTPHHSQPNRAQSSRRSWFITYAKRSADSKRLMALYDAALDDVHRAHRRDALT